MSKLSVTPFSCEQAFNFSHSNLIKNFILGNDEFGLRGVANFNLKEISQINTYGKDVWVSVNKIMHKTDIDKLKVFLVELDNIQIKGIIFSDLGVYTLVKQLGLKLELIYNTETTITNNAFTIFAKEQGIYGVELAKEISLSKIKEIAEHKEAAISINIHGHIYMYQSVRKMISNYEVVQEMDINRNQRLYLYDDERETYFPIVENQQGTHVLSNKDLCTIHKLDEILNLDIDFLKIDGFLYSPSNYEAIVSLYLEVIEAINSGDEINLRDYFKAIKNIDQSKSYNTGFLYKETVF